MTEARGRGRADGGGSGESQELSERGGEARPLLVTGPAHAGTRLVIRMLAAHPEVTVPGSLLNEVGEFPPLHNLFLRAQARAPMHREELPVDRRELAFVLEAYRREIPAGAPFYALKMPHYPLFCLEKFGEALGEGPVLFVDRPTEKIVASFRRRGEDIRYYRPPDRRYDQIKLCRLGDRSRLLAEGTPVEIIRAQAEGARSLVDRWAQDRGERGIVRVEVERFAADVAYRKALLEGIGLDPGAATALGAVVDRARLLGGSPLRSALRGVRTALRRTAEHVRLRLMP